jgi:hypothetical protein
LNKSVALGTAYRLGEQPQAVQRLVGETHNVWTRWRNPNGPWSDQQKLWETPDDEGSISTSVTAGHRVPTLLTLADEVIKQAAVCCAT